MCYQSVFKHIFISLIFWGTVTNLIALGNNYSPNQLIIIDKSVNDHELIINDIKKTNNNNALLILPVDRHTSGVKQISHYIRSLNVHINTIHIISHGKPGMLFLGSDVLNSNNLDSFENDLRDWKEKLTSNTDLLLYGCDVAKGSEGQSFLKHLQEKLNVNIAASNNKTGNSQQEGDYNLEQTLGELSSPSIFSKSLQASYKHVFGLPYYHPDTSLVGTSVLNQSLDVLSLKDGGFVVVWDPNGRQINYKIYNADASLRASGTTLAHTDSAGGVTGAWNAKRRMDVALLGDDKFVIMKHIYTQGPIYQVHKYDGSKVGNKINLPITNSSLGYDSSKTYFTAQSLAAASLDNGKAMFFFTANVFNAPISFNSPVRLMRVEINKNGSYSISPTGMSSYEIQVDKLTSGEFIIANAVSFSAVQLHLLSKDGYSFGTALTTMSVFNAGHLTHPVYLKALDNGGFLVGYRAMINAPGRFDYYLQVFDSNKRRININGQYQYNIAEGVDRTPPYLYVTYRHQALVKAENGYKFVYPLTYGRNSLLYKADVSSNFQNVSGHSIFYSHGQDPKRFAGSYPNSIEVIDSAVLNNGKEIIVMGLGMGYTIRPLAEVRMVISSAGVKCGNNKIDAGEGCDDNNVTDGDGCSSECQVESGCSCPGTISDPIAGVCNCNQAPSLSISPDTVSLNTIEGASSNLGIITATDEDETDVVSITVTNVETSSDKLTSMSDALLGMLTLSNQTIISSEQTSGTVDWGLELTQEVIDALDHNEEVSLTYTIEIKDNNGLTNTALILVTITGKECLADTDCLLENTFCDKTLGCIQCKNNNDCLRISEQKPYCSDSNICYNYIPTFTGNNDFTLDLNQSNKLTNKIVVTDENKQDTVYLFVEDVEDVNNNSGLTKSALMQLIQPRVVPRLISSNAQTADYTWTLDLTDISISKEVQLIYTITAADKNNGSSQYPLKFKIKPSNNIVGNLNIDDVDEVDEVNSVGDAGEVDTNVTNNMTSDLDTATSSESSSMDEINTNKKPANHICINQMNPKKSLLNLKASSDIQQCITKKDNKVITCTIKEIGEFRENIKIACGELVKYCNDSTRGLNKNNKPIKSVSRCKPDFSEGMVSHMCVNKMNPKHSQLNLTAGGDIKECITKKDNNPLTCTVEEIGEFKENIKITCPDQVSYCNDSTRGLNKNNKPIKSVSGCKVVYE